MSRLLFFGPIVWACLFCSLPVLAQENTTVSNPTTPEPEVALDELIRRAFDNNPQIPVARAAQEAARERVEAARANTGPSLQIVPGVGNRTARDEEIILSQPIDLFGRRRARTAVAAAQVRAARAQYNLAERSLIVAVKNAVANLYAAQEAEEMSEMQVGAAQNLRNAAARRAELGDVAPVQVERAEIELLRAQNELTVAQAERLARRAALNQLIGQEPQAPLRVSLPESAEFLDASKVSATPLSLDGTNSREPVETTAIPATPAIEAPSIARSEPPQAVVQQSVVGGSSQVGSDLLATRSQAVEGLLQRPDIVGAQATLEARRAQIEVLQSNRRPSLEIQARRSSATGSGSTALRAVVVVPLFDLGANRSERKALEAEVREQEAQITLLRSQAATQVEQALLRLQQQRQTAQRYHTGIVPRTAKLVRKTQIGYEQGASTYLEVIEAQRTLRQVQNEYLQAIIGIRTSEAALETALGMAPPGERQTAAPANSVEAR